MRSLQEFLKNGERKRQSPDNKGITAQPSSVDQSTNPIEQSDTNANPDNAACKAERIEDTCEMLDSATEEDSRPKTSQEKNGVIEATETLRDQHAEHYEIKPDGSVRYYSKKLGKDEVAGFLKDTQKPKKRPGRRSVA